MKNESDLGGQALDKVTEMAIESQLDTSESVDVDIKTDPLQLMQGKVDSVDFTGKGMVMKQDLRVDSITINTGAVSINPLKAMLGQMELSQPAAAQAEIVLTEADLNRALGSDYLKSKLQTVTCTSGNTSYEVQIQQAKVKFQEQRVVLSTELVLPQTDERKSLTATVIPSIQDDGYRIGLEVVDFEGQGITLEFVSALVNQVTDLVNLRNFELSGMMLQLQDFKIQSEQLLIQAKTILEKIPTSANAAS